MNKGELNTTITRYLKRNDLIDLYDTWIAFTSTRIDTQLRLSEQEYRTITVPDSQFVQLPPDFIEMRHIQTSQNGGRPLRYVTPNKLDQLRARYSDSFAPMGFYTIMDNQIEISPAPGPDNEATLEMFYYAKLPPLPGNQSTNKVLTAFPQLYLYGVMIESAAIREAPQDIQMYTQLWRDYAKTLTDRQAAARFSGDSKQMRAS